jgi:tungstate transport system ATP-binding protein
MMATASLLPLQLHDLVFVAGNRRIIDGITLDFAAGTRTIVVGPNGAGKSVLLRLCHGLLSPTSGRVAWHSVPEPGTPRRQAMVFQRPVMLRRSAIANVVYALQAAGYPRDEHRERAHAALQRVGLMSVAEHAARVLSGGEQQRLALARAWAIEPEVLFLDEPTANLDPGATHEIEAVIEAMHRGGTKIIMVTHNLGQAHRMGDEILFIHRGRLAERSPADRFFKHPATSEAAEFIKGELPW